MNFSQLLRVLLVRWGGKLPAGVVNTAGWLAVAALAVFLLFGMVLWALPVALALGAGFFLGRQKDLGEKLLRWRRGTPPTTGRIGPGSAACTRTWPVTVWPRAGATPPS